MIGLTELSSPAVKYRIDKAADFLDGVVNRLLAAAGQSAPLHWPGRILRAADGSGISQHASQGLDWRVHGVFDLGCGRFSHLALTDCHGAESMTRGAPVDGEIRVGDRNYARAGVLHTLRLARTDASPVHPESGKPKSPTRSRAYLNAYGAEAHPTAFARHSCPQSRCWSN